MSLLRDMVHSAKSVSFFVNLVFFHYWKNVSAGRIWPWGRCLETPGVEEKAQLLHDEPATLTSVYNAVPHWAWTTRRNNCTCNAAIGLCLHYATQNVLSYSALYLLP